MAQTSKLNARLDRELRRRVAGLAAIGEPANDLAIASAVEAGIPPDAISSPVHHGVPESFTFDKIVPKRQFEARTPLELLRTRAGGEIVEQSLLRSYFGFGA